MLFAADFGGTRGIHLPAGHHSRTVPFRANLQNNSANWIADIGLRNNYG